VIDHVSLGVADITAARDFYDKVLETLGLKRLYSMEFAAAYGDKYPGFWIGLPVDRKPASAGNGCHICFQASSRAAVDAFHAAAMEAGGGDAGAPGLRPEYTETYYGAFAFDPDGNKIEAVCYASD